MHKTIDETRKEIIEILADPGVNQVDLSSITDEQRKRILDALRKGMDERLQSITFDKFLTNSTPEQHDYAMLNQDVEWSHYVFGTITPKQLQVLAAMYKNLQGQQ